MKLIRKKRKPEPEPAVLPRSPLDPPNAPAQRATAPEKAPDVRVKMPRSRGGELVIAGGDPFGAADYKAPQPDDPADVRRETVRALLHRDP